MNPIASPSAAARATTLGPRHAPTPGACPSGSAEAQTPPELSAPMEHELIEGPSREDLIRRRAYDLYERNGRVDGRAHEDWLTAEAELGREVLEGASPMDEPIGRE